MIEDYAEKLLAIDVNIEITKMLDISWELFSKYFKVEEVGIKQEFVEKYETFKPLLYLVQALQKLYEGNHQKALQILENVDREYIADSERIFNPYVFNLQVEIYLADQNYVMALETANNFLQTLKNQEESKSTDWIESSGRSQPRITCSSGYG